MLFDAYLYASVDSLVALTLRTAYSHAFDCFGVSPKGELRSPSSRLARLLKPFGVKPRQLWINEANTRGYDAEGFASDTCAPYLKRDARTLEDARPGSRSQAPFSVSNVASVLSDASRRRGSRPLIGDARYPRVLADTVRGGQITEVECEQQYALHDAVAAARAERGS